MKNPLDWREIEEALFETGKSAILKFSKEHKGELCSFLAYAWTVVDGDFSICFDTQSNARRIARENEQEVITQRKLMLGGAQSWKNAHYFLTNPLIVDYASGVDLFAYPIYEQVWIDNWNAFAANEALPKSQNGQDTYLEGNVRLIIWKVLERLIEANLFDSLALSFPFRLGYQFHGQEITVLRILNWPEE